MRQKQILFEILKKPGAYAVKAASLVVFLVLLVGVYREVDQIYWGSLDLKHLFSMRLALVFGAYVAISGLGNLVWLVEIWLPDQADRIHRRVSRLGWGAWVGIGFLAVFNAWFIGYIEWGSILKDPFLRLTFLSGGLGLAAGLIPRDTLGRFNWFGWLGGAVLFGCTAGAAYLLQSAVSYPFGLSWSEGNRLWDYSVMYGRGRYLYPPDLPIEAYIDNGRQSLWGLPFMLPWANIQLVRLWSALVFSVPYALLGWFVFKPRKGETGTWLLLGLFSYLFLQQGPIYSPLVLAAVLVASIRKLPFWLGLLMVGLAGYYAAISRYTWMAAPAAYAVLLTFLQPGIKAAESTQLQARRETILRWVRAIGMGLAGLTGGFVLPTLLPRLSAWWNGSASAPVEEIAQNYSTLLNRQPLLWDRLLPNETYAPGILLGLLLAAGPLAVALIYLVVSGRWKLDFWQKLALAGVSGVFLGVGLLVSVKIGGGSNLHNMDMFLITLVFAAGLAWEAGAKLWVQGLPLRRAWEIAILGFMVVYPGIELQLSLKPMYYPERNVVIEAIDLIQIESNKALQSGEVLFMDQRQLLTFGYVRGIPLVPEYEKKRMMDEAMSDHAVYFKPFYEDIQKRRFSLIISEPLQLFIRPDEYNFGNENNAWVKWVSNPLLCYYEPGVTVEAVRIQLLYPRAVPCR